MLPKLLAPSVTRVGQASVIADIGAHLAAKHPVRPARVDQDHRQQEQRADQQERLRARRRGGLPQRERDAARSSATG